MCEDVLGKKGKTNMSNYFTAIAFALAVGLFSTNAYAENGKYKGLKRINIIVEDLTEKSKKCGFTKDALQTAAAFPIFTGTKLKPSKGTVAFYIQVNALPVVAGCTAGWSVQIYLYQNVELEYGPKLYTTVELDHKSGMSRGPKDFIVRNAIKQIENMAKAFSVQWALDNQ
jgi:hypothetical protein